MYLITSMHPYYDFTGDSGDRIAHRESLRKKPRTRIVREPTQNRGRGTNRRPRRGSRQQDADVVMMEEEEVSIANLKDMSRKDWRPIRRILIAFQREPVKGITVSGHALSSRCGMSSTWLLLRKLSSPRYVMRSMLLNTRTMA